MIGANQLHTTRPTTTLPLLIKNSCGRSIAFAAGELIVHSGKSNGVVGRDVIRNAALLQMDLEGLKAGTQ
jgi:hypothetical protein